MNSRLSVIAFGEKSTFVDSCRYRFAMNTLQGGEEVGVSLSKIHTMLSIARSPARLLLKGGSLHEG
jgi:hypothetical protein